MSTTTPAAGRPSMADVARLAQVSTQTVSRYFTGVGYVREETRKRITAAVDDLGYRRNQSARRFRTQQTNMVGVLSMGPINYGSAEILTGLGIAAHEVGMTLTISQMDVDWRDDTWVDEVVQSLEHLLSIPVDGVVVVTPYAGIEDALHDRMGVTPMVTVSDRPGSPASVASIHAHAAARTATEHLIGLGHTRIVHVAGPPGRIDARERIRGYGDAMTAAGLEPTVIELATDWSPQAGFAAARELGSPRRFTAAFCANDEIALGFISGMGGLGFQAPRDFSVVGLDDMPAAAYLSPPLTTIRLDFRRLGGEAFRMLQTELVTGEPGRYDSVEPELVVRASTGAPGAG
jgi:DNA-binding LacI/PurR family transcriptional regulator